MNRLRLLLLLVAGVACGSILPALLRSNASAQDQQPAKMYQRENLVAWCIVPFDGKKRGPAARAEMLQRLGLRRVAYDWREEHVPTFEQEIQEYKKHGLEYFAFWGEHPEAFKLFAKYDLHPQIWQLAVSPEGDTQESRVAAAVAQILPLVEKTRRMGCELGLYNHGGWGGEPENLIAVCERLRQEHQADHVGIVYNQHHAHAKIDQFGKAIARMKPYLLCLNLNGMTRDGDQVGKKILPLGEGEFDVKLLKAIQDSGYRGPIGIIGHTQDDVEQRLQDNLDGLEWIKPQLQGKPPGPKPTWRTWSPADNARHSRDSQGVLVQGKPEFRRPPLTCECRIQLTERNRYNILVASDTKASGAHWELFSMNGSGMLTAYLPGMNPDHVRSEAMICDGRLHTIGMTYETDRVRLFVDGAEVANQKVTSTGRAVRPGRLGIGRLVSGQLGCSGTIDWVRISKGIRSPTAEASVERDSDTLLLWQRPEKQLQQLLGRSQQFSATRVRDLLKLARQQGNPHRGLLVFSSAQTACLSCHKVSGQGGSVGPELTRLGRERKPNAIVESLLWPQREVKPEYQAHAILTADGKALRGYILKRDAEQLEFRDPTRSDQQVLQIALSEVEDLQTVGTLMPDNLVASLTEKTLADLLQFLLTLGTDEGVEPKELASLLEHAQMHHRPPATFPVEQKPLHPEAWPNWKHAVNRDRVYDFYAKQAEHFRTQPTRPAMIAEFPGLDGGEQGHWGNQNDDYWASDRWNDATLGSLHCGIVKGHGKNVARGVSVQLGDQHEMSACFNPDTLSYEAIWTGDFLRFSSFRHGFLDGSIIAGTIQPLPQLAPPDSSARYRGFYRIGNRIAFAYEIEGVEYWDSPWCENGKFVRTVAVADRHPLKKQLRTLKPAWPQRLETKILLGTQQPYAVDTIELPFENPWKTQIFVGGLAFQEDGSALVCTMHGDVWLVSGLEYPSQTARWKRFAAGLHHPQGMVIDEDGIFVLGRDQLTRLHDLNQDGEADFYECFSTAYETSTAGHDFICGLQRDAAGRFYLASGNQGIVRLSADGQRAKVLATGFRNPDGLGLLPDGTVTVPCSEGEWTPASMICAVRPSLQPSFHGYGGPQDGSPPELPLAYLPRGLDNSAGGQVYVSSERWGPLQQQLIHLSFGTGAHFLLLRDEVQGQLQGAIVPLPGEFLSGVHRGRFSPQDGQLYVGGMQGWGTYTPDDGCLQRVRYTGASVQLPIGFHLHENGILLEFSDSLDASLVEDPANHFAQCWNYRYSSGYGSPEFSTLHPGMRGHDPLTIKSSHVLASGNALFLEIPDLQPANQVHLWLQPDPDHRTEMFITAHQLDEPFTQFPGYAPQPKEITPHPILADVLRAQYRVPNPHTAQIPDAREIEIATGTNLSFATRSIRVKAGEPLALTLSNPDVVPHNWVLAKPGTLRRLGQLANQLISDPEAAGRQYVPRSSDVLAYTDIVLPQDAFTIYFRAPEQPGRYPYLCTFPGHWLIMNGEMIVE